MRARRASSDRLQPRSAQAIRTASPDRTTTRPAGPFLTAAGLLILGHSFEIRGSETDPLETHSPAAPPGRRCHQAVCRCTRRRRAWTGARICARREKASDRARPPGEAVSFTKTREGSLHDVRRLARVKAGEGVAEIAIVTCCECFFVGVRGATDGTQQTEVVNVRKLVIIECKVAPDQKARRQLRRPFSIGKALARSVAIDNAASSSTSRMPLAVGA